MIIYKIEEWIPETGRGEVVAYCGDKQDVVNFLTDGGKSHCKLMNEFDDGKVDIFNKCILRLVPDDSYYGSNDFCDPFDFLKPKTEYFIIFEIEVFTKDNKDESKAY